ncbi:hypothetical protein NM688_g190 [Phlebia brevispora]|uniref:Uncharacterized protein n=1 Tax=Phlebia brevispora TaxID=194682 RepID=A0ACC1TEX7_9APHY|nr:hypothetical protein NM688_g190 [Phlebia brevispora]
MSVALAVWSLELKGGDQHAQEITPAADLRITNVALGADLADAKGRTTLKLVYLPLGDSDDEDEDEDEDEEDGDDAPKGEPAEATLCTLIPGQIEQVNLNIVLPADRPAVFASVGKNTIYLAGNYIDQLLPDEPPSEDELMDGVVDESEDEEDEEEEEEEETLVEDKKRPREPEASEVSEEPQLSKKERKKLNKKLKAQNGEAVPTGEAAPAEAESLKKAKESKPADEQKEKHKGKSVERELTGGVKIVDHKVGTGPKAKTGDKVSMHYVGKLANGKVFDSNTKGDSFDFVLGGNQVIKGWDTGIVGMQRGGERLITIPPAMGYGKKAQKKIPANSTLIFEVKLLKINDA